jgi:hypothetical protein
VKAAFVALVALAALGIALLLGAPPATAVQVTLVATAAIAVLTAALRVGASLPRPAFLFERSSQRRRSMSRRPPSPTLDALEWTLLFSAERELDLYGRLRPLLRDISAARLAAVGIDLDRSPAAAELLGPELWSIVRPDRDPPADRHAPGPGLPAIERALADLEAIRA